MNELVEVGERDEIALQQFGALLGLAQFEARAAQNDLAAMLDVALDHFLEIKRLGLALVNGKGVDAEGNFKLRVLVEFVDDDLGQTVALEFHDEPRVLVRLVAHGRDFRDDLLVHQIGNLLFQRGAIHVERNLRDDELLAVTLEFLGADPAPQLDAALAGLEVILDSLNAANHPARGEVRAFDELHQA